MTYLSTRASSIPRVRGGGRIPIRRLPPLSAELRRALAVRRAIHARRPDVVIACLAGPGMYAELAKLPAAALRADRFRGRPFPGDTVRLSHRLRLGAHCIWRTSVVTQTDHVRRLLAQAAPWLAGRIAVIRNGVDLAEFHVPGRTRTPYEVPRTGTTRVLVLAGYRPEKNPFGMLATMEHLRTHGSNPGARVELDWYGSTGAAYGLDGVYQEAPGRRCANRGLDDVFRLHGPVRDTAATLPQGFDRLPALVLRGLLQRDLRSGSQRRTPGGLRHLRQPEVRAGRRHRLPGRPGCSRPPSPTPSCVSTACPAAAKRAMGRRARAHAEALFDPDRFADSFAALIERVAPGRRSSSPGIPSTAGYDGLKNVLRSRTGDAW